mgnify:FL=1
MKTIDIEKLRDTLAFCPDTGIFTWRTNRQKSLIGKENKEVLNTGYITVRVFGRRYLAHRLAWAYTYGHLPSAYIDHINGDKSDNRICNLRECSHAENHQNMAIQSNNKSGYIGVGWHRLRNKWRASITINRKHIHLGFYPTAEAAYEAYCEAKSKYHKFQPAHR